MTGRGESMGEAQDVTQEKGKGNDMQRRKYREKEEIFKDINISKTKKNISKNVGRGELVRRRKLQVA
jgi:hypothetical protein